MSVAEVFNRRVRGFRVVEVVGLAILLTLVTGVYLAKTFAGSERQEIGRIEQQIEQEQVRKRLLAAEVAHLEQPRRIEQLAQMLQLQPIAADHEITEDALIDVARRRELPRAPVTAAPRAVSPISPPARIQGLGNFHAAISIGKFHGTIAPTTPSGSRVTRPSSSGPVAAISPYTLSSASPVQLTQRMVAATSTWRASVTGLPMSSASSSASSSPCFSISWANFSSTFLRWVGFAFAHAPASKLRRAAATARSMSSPPPSATFARTRPSMGLTQSKGLPLAAST